MEHSKRYSLEDFAERHRADFDLHEPRPELWDMLEKQLDVDATDKASAPRLSIAPELSQLAQAAEVSTTQPKLRLQRAQWVRYGLAATLLLAVAGLGGFWRTQHQASMIARGGLMPMSAGARAVADAAAYLGPDASVMNASQGGTNADARLDTAVHGMERYYAVQLTERKAQLSQLDPASAAEWTRELVSLDSSYQQLKRELPQHPQPENVLMAMNRNLQIRLDILDRQLELRGADQLAQGAVGSEYALADSRSLAENIVHRHAQ